jgi:hypothetical protein
MTLASRWLLVLVPASALLVHVIAVSAIAVFAVASLAIVPMADWPRWATEERVRVAGSTIGGSIIGNSLLGVAIVAGSCCRPFRRASRSAMASSRPCAGFASGQSAPRSRAQRR